VPILHGDAVARQVACSAATGSTLHFAVFPGGVIPTEAVFQATPTEVSRPQLPGGHGLLFF